MTGVEDEIFIKQRINQRVAREKEHIKQKKILALNAPETSETERTYPVVGCVYYQRGHIYSGMGKEGPHTDNKM